MKRLAAVAIALFIALSAVAAPPKVTTIFIVRHAEKAGPEGDVPLSDAGRARAVELLRVLGSADVKAIYETQFQRTQQTAAPLAAALHVTPTRIETGPAYAKGVVSDISKHHAGETVLVVSHSNTIGDILHELGIAAPPPIADTQFDDLFVVTGKKLTALRYGAVAR